MLDSFNADERPTTTMGLYRDFETRKSNLPSGGLPALVWNQKNENQRQARAHWQCRTRWNRNR